MKINKFFLTILSMNILLLFPIFKVSALEKIYMTNNNGIDITNIEYHNLLNLGFTEDEILNMTIGEFNENRNLDGKILSQEIKIVPSKNTIDNSNNGFGLFGIQNASVTTSEKTLLPLLYLLMEGISIR